MAEELLGVLGNLDGIGRSLLLGSFWVRGVGQAERASAVVALLFDVVLLRQRRQACAITAKLTCMIDDDFRVALVLSYFPVHFDAATLQFANVSDIL